ncbi:MULTISPECIES: fibronectin type III domain-containing protein [Streptomyces]|uniref:Fibronectin type III domain-containing protein n=1 Tax=Streptomyces nigra TaxID=1827580 RepID=A0ABZ1J619_9ACTN|nr:fibronectin type III domain-containing protein [Streptomyces sp. RK62]MBQ0995698.1 fibronectin type III domain-containing protein [Streptomyces sp. RK62]
MRGRLVAVPAALILALPACSAGTPPALSLTGALTTPTDVDLRWRDTRPGVAGHVLEFATEEAGPWTVLQYLAPQVTTYRHPDLMPHTTFHYRLRPYTGPTTRPRRTTGPDGAQHLTWTDRARGEDGHLLELRPRDGDRYDPVAVLAPDTEATDFLPLPGERGAAYRVRAFVLGERSGVVRLTTGE